MKTWFKYMKKYRIYALLCPLLMIMEVISDILIPFLMSKIVDVGIANRDVDYSIKLAIIMIIIASLAMIFGILSSYFSSKACHGLGSEIRKAVFKKIQNISLTSFNKFKVASLVTRLTNDCTTISTVTMLVLRLLVRAPFMMIFALIMSFYINKKLALISLMMIPIILILSFIIIKKAKPLFKKAQEKIDRLSLIIQENLIAIKIVKSFNRQKSETKKFKEANEEFRSTIYSAIKLALYIFPLLTLSLYSSIIAILWIGSFEITSGTIRKGELISFITYNTQILISLLMIAMVFVELMRGFTSLGRINEVLNEDDAIIDKKNLKNTVCSGEIIFDDVAFSYLENGKYVLKNLNFKIKSGETVGIIGPTGSGKTTLVQLLPRLYDISKGAIKIGKEDIKNISPHALRDNISYVLQKNVLFSGNIRDNIKFENQDITDVEIIKALKMAEAWEFISKNENPLETYVEQGGKNFSGGQKQRLSIARAFARNSKIIIFDDATSAIDTDTERKIMNNFKKNFPDATKIIISQKISSIEDADKIIVMNDGNIDAIGTSDDIINTSEIYKEIYNSQKKRVK